MNQETAPESLARLRPRLLRRARRYVPDWDAAEDLVQETVLRVWLRLKRDPPITDLERYLFRALRNLATRPRPRFEALDEADLPADPPRGEDRVEAGRVLAALARLPETQSSLILDRALEGASYAELARRHRLPLGTVMSRVARGRAALRASGK